MMLQPTEEEERLYKKMHEAKTREETKKAEGKLKEYLVKVFEKNRNFPFKD